MINYLLYSFPKNKLEKTQKIFFYQFIASSSIFLASVLALSLEIHVYTIITGIIGVIWFLIVLYFTECNTKKSVSTDYHKYNEKLDTLRKILIDAKYDMPTLNDGSSSIQSNWYTKDKLEYLIKEFEKLVFPPPIFDSPEVKPLIKALIPLVVFVGGVLTEKAELETSIQIAVVAGVIVLIFWFFFKMINDLSDIFSLYTSTYQKKRIYSLLRDLYIRDFDSMP